MGAIQKEKGEGGKEVREEEGEKETLRVFSFDTPQREKMEKKMEAQGELW